jgi:hypothetical protein
MTQINQYPVEATTIKDDDYFDIDKFDPDLGFESQKTKWSTIKNQILADGAFKNLGSNDLTQVDPTRKYNGLGNQLDFDNMNGVNIEIENTNTGNGFTVRRNFAPRAQRKLSSWANDTHTHTSIYEDGTFHSERGNTFFGDGTLSPAVTVGNQMNSGALSLFASTNKPSVFTDVIFPDLPPYSDQSKLVWFRSTTKGVQFPVMTTTQRDLIPAPTVGLVIFNDTLNKMQVYTGVGVSGWSNMN